MFIFALLYTGHSHYKPQSVSHIGRRNRSKKSPRAFVSRSDYIVSRPE